MLAFVGLPGKGGTTTIPTAVAHNLRDSGAKFDSTTDGGAESCVCTVSWVASCWGGEAVTRTPPISPCENGCLGSIRIPFGKARIFR